MAKDKKDDKVGCSKNEFLLNEQFLKDLPKECEYSSNSQVDIQTRIRYSRQYLEEDGDLAEMVTIILGDGGLTEDCLIITLNRIDEADYVKYVAEFMEELFGKTPSFYPTGDKGVRLTIYGKELVEELVSHGLEIGNKVKNQVSVPNWIKDLFIKRGLKGLTDTDCGIHINRASLNIIITFYNSSKPLVKDFKEMCSVLDIDTSKIYEKEDDSAEDKFYTRITKKDHVKRFIDIVRPLKWKFRRYYLGINLIAFSDPRYKDLIANEVLKYCEKLGIKTATYTKHFEAFLTDTCLKYGLDISESAIDNAISKAFKFIHFPYREEYGKLFTSLFEELGNLLAIRNYLSVYLNLSPKPETIKSHMKKFKKNQGKDFSSWYNNIKKKNIRQIIVKKKNRNYFITQFPSNLRRIVLIEINKIFTKNELITNSQIINKLLNKKNKNFIRLQYPLKDLKVKKVINFYLDDLVRLVRTIIELKNSRKEIKPFKLAQNFNSKALLSTHQLRKIIYQVISLNSEGFY